MALATARRRRCANSAKRIRRLFSGLGRIRARTTRSTPAFSGRPEILSRFSTRMTATSRSAWLPVWPLFSQTLQSMRLQAWSPSSMSKGVAYRAPGMTTRWPFTNRKMTSPSRCSMRTFWSPLQTCLSGARYLKPLVLLRPCATPMIWSSFCVWSWESGASTSSINRYWRIACTAKTRSRKARFARILSALRYSPFSYIGNGLGRAQTARCMWAWRVISRFCTIRMFLRSWKIS